MNKGWMTWKAFLAALLAATTMSGAYAASASAGPEWFFEGVKLTGNETITNDPPQVSFTVPGISFYCTPRPLEMTIWNEGGVGEGSVEELPLVDCTTDSAVCWVEEAVSEALPWTAGLTEPKSGGDHLVIKGVGIGMLIGGPECVLNEFFLEFEGSLGGRIDNTTETITFDAASFAATGTGLKAFGQKVEFEGVVEMRATGPHIGEPLEVN